MKAHILLFVVALTLVSSANAIAASSICIQDPSLTCESDMRNVSCAVRESKEAVPPPVKRLTCLRSIGSGRSETIAVDPGFVMGEERGIGERWMRVLEYANQTNQPILLQIYDGCSDARQYGSRNAKPYGEIFSITLAPADGACS